MKGKKVEDKVRMSTVQYGSRPTHEGKGMFRKSGYTRFPKISIAGLWLEELGFHVGDKLQVEYGEGYLHISRANASMVCEESSYTDAEETQGTGKTT
ncbi:MAG: type I toxin-antitoxin system SymE family toxin [Candidatus Gastranaerophilales bacterium]|nr:type I toxin-antitoxin system SymE family toxin [Candidatus Gastranaerophilales bacterium]